MSEKTIIVELERTTNDEEMTTFSVSLEFMSWDFVFHARNYWSGHWEGKKWIFPASAYENVKDYLYRNWNWTPHCKFQSFMFTVNKKLIGDCSPVNGNNICMATAQGRDSGARLGKGLILKRGEIRSAGSIKNWITVVEEGTEFILSLPKGYTSSDDHITATPYNVPDLTKELK